MENIFKDAYFGKAYKTRDGRKAIFFQLDTIMDDNGNAIGQLAYVYTLRDGEYSVALNGISTSENDIILHNVNTIELNEDIVSEWCEVINEDDYENKIKSLIDSCIYWEAYEDEPELFAKALKELLDFASSDKRTIDFCSDMIKSRKTIFNEVNKAITSSRSKSDKFNEEELEEYAGSVSETFWSDDMEMFDGNPLEKDIYYVC